MRCLVRLVLRQAQHERVSALYAIFDPSLALRGRLGEGLIAERPLTL